MDKLEVETKQLPDGRMLFYTTDPGVVLAQPHSRPYGFTGVVNRAWIEAACLVGQQYTPRDINAGWPEAIEPHRLACLQCPQDPTGQTYVNSALIAACEGGVMPHTTFRRIDYMGGNELRREYLDCAIAAKDFAVWLTAQGEEPSVHIAAWFKATGVTPAAPATDTAPPTPVTETKEQRQDKRLQACIDAGLPLGNTKAVLLRLPDGMSAVAKSLGIARQSLTADVKAALQRRLATENVRGTVHRAS